MFNLKHLFQLFAWFLVIVIVAVVIAIVIVIIIIIDIVIVIIIVIVVVTVCYYYYCYLKKNYINQRHFLTHISPEFLIGMVIIAL